MSLEKTYEQLCFCWNLIYVCNYRCPYCYFYGRWEQLKRMKIISADDWIKGWQRIYDIYGSARIQTSGGEPFIFPSFSKCVNEICKMHNLEITTNLSCSVSMLDSLIKQNNPERLSWIVSFHPSFTDLETFLKKISSLKKSNFEVRVMYVAYPPQLKQMEYFKNKFQEQGVDFFIQAFQGEYNGIIYPEGYTEEVRRKIYILDSDNDVQLKRLAENQLLKRATRGKLCLAGFKYVYIDLDGSVLRCSRERTPLLGNFLKGDFKLLEQPLPCALEYCPCEFVWLVEENQEDSRYDSKRQSINTDSLLQDNRITTSDSDIDSNIGCFFESENNLNNEYRQKECKNFFDFFFE